MRLIDCEISHRHVRGQNLIVIYGERGVSADELDQLMAEYREAYGPADIAPIYVSADGWQAGAAEPLGPLASRFVFDEAQEIVIVDGIKIAGEVFSTIGTRTPEGDWLRVVSVDDTATIERRHVDELQLVADGVLVAADRAEAFARWELIEAAAGQGGAAAPAPVDGATTEAIAADATSTAAPTDKPAATGRGKKATG